MKVVYSKYNRDRKRQFQIETTIIEQDGATIVRKKALTEEAKGHLDTIKKNTSLLMGNSGDFFVLQEIEKEESSVIYPFLEGETFSKKLIKILKDNRISEFVQQIKEFKNSLYSIPGEYLELYRLEDHLPFGEGFSKILNNVYCIKPANLDLVFDNIIVSENGTKTIIDSEWVFNSEVPVEFIFFRSLYSLWIKYKSILENKFKTLKEFMASFDIVSEQYDNFLVMEEDFFQTYVYGDKPGRFSLLNYKKPRLSFSQIQSILNNYRYNVAIKDEEDNLLSLSSQSQCDDFVEITFNIDLNKDDVNSRNNIIALQPVDKQAYVVIESLLLYNEFGELIYSSAKGFNDITYSNNIILFENQKSFCFIAFNNEPRIIITLDEDFVGSKCKLIVKMKVDFNLSTYYREIFIGNLTTIDELNREISLKKDNIDFNNKVIEDKDQLISLQAKKIASYEDSIELYKTKIESYEKKISLKDQHIEVCEQKIEEIEQDLMLLLNSKSWKVTAPLRKIRSVLGSDENN